MNVKFKFTDPEKVEPVRIEQVFAEKPGGGLVGNPDYDVPPTTAVAEVEGVFVPLKCYRVAENAANDATSIKIEKGSGIAVGDILAHGSVAVECTAVDKSNADYDTVTVSMGVALTAGTVLYESNAEPVAAGYYDAESTDEGALQVVASGATTGQINLADATPYKGSKSPLAANDYVIYNDEVVAAPVYTPTFVTGNYVYAGEGDQLVRLINGANLRKETANIASEVAALLPMINLV